MSKVDKLLNILESELPLYKGVFNWYKEIYTLYTHAKDVNIAKSNLFKQLADKLKREVSSVYNHYKDKEQSYSINIQDKELEAKEGDTKIETKGRVTTHYYKENNKWIPYRVIFN
jgi:uncharacterized protein (UPF0248 family)